MNKTILIFGLLTMDANHCRAWGCFIRTSLKMSNQEFLKKIRIHRAKLHNIKPTQLPFLWIWTCIALNLQLLQLLGVAEYLSIDLNRVLKPCTNLGTGLWKRTSKGLAWWCFVLLLDAILSIAAASCSSFNSQALQSMCLGKLIKCQARYRWLCPAECLCGGGSKGKACVTLLNAAGNVIPGRCLMPSMIQVMVVLKWQSAWYWF